MAQKDTCTPMFIEALFTIAKTRKKNTRPSIDEWIKEIVYIPHGVLVSHWKECMQFATWMDLEIITLSEVSQTEKGKYHMISLLGRILKNDTNELIYKTEIDL